MEMLKESPARRCSNRLAIEELQSFNACNEHRHLLVLTDIDAAVAKHINKIVPLSIILKPLTVRACVIRPHLAQGRHRLFSDMQIALRAPCWHHVADHDLQLAHAPLILIFCL